MKKIVLVIVLSTCFLKTYAQDYLVDQLNLEFNFIGIGASYEIPLSDKFLLDFGAGVGGGVEGSGSYVWELNSSLAPYLKGELKYIYNRDKRLKKGKSITNNSGNYIAFQSKYFGNRFSEDSNFSQLKSALLNEIHWGLQRSMGGNWLFNFHIGLGYLSDLDGNDSGVSPTLGLKFSYKLF